MTFSGVAANFGGIPLAFAFIASLGPLGVVTVFLQNQLHYDITAHGFSLFSVVGLGLAYMYFQLPLMILVIAPAIEGLKRSGVRPPRISARPSGSSGDTSAYPC